MAEVKERVVLPKCIVPSSYHLVLHPDLEKFTFDGTVRIVAEVVEPTNKVVVNALDMTISSMTAKQSDTVLEASGDGIVFSEEEETVTCTLASTLSKGSVEIEFTYVGNLNDKMKGFYRSKHVEDGVEKWTGCTQMEPTDARRAFPGWDEPAIKASFEVTLVVKEEFMCISNMPEAEVTMEGGKRRTRFEITPPMSTYLLAWVVGDFVCLEDTIPKTHDPTKTTLLRCFATKSKVNKGRFALDVAKRTLPFYEKYFGSDYPLPKSDLIALPDFAAGAMENWGLVTYRETALLCDEDSGAAARQWVALVVTHELAHQWFGNLVTMEWWKELWLNEGFACWIEYLATDTLFPEWNIWTTFVNNEFTSALSLDGLLSSHPIEVDVYRAQEVDEIFDAISYSKGAAVIRMLQSWAGAEEFRKGLVTYLDAFKYKNAHTVDLWEHLSRSSGKDVASAMADWTGQQGFPVLTATRSGDILTLEQHRFLSSGAATPEQDQTVWHVPLKIATGVAGEPLMVMLKDRKMDVTLPAGTTWLKVNAEQSAVVRVHYSGVELWDQVVSGLQEGKLSTVDRMGLVNDTVALAKSGQGSLTAVLQLVKGCQDEKEYTVWSVIDGAIRSARKVVGEDATAQSKLDALVCTLMRPRATELGWDPRPTDGHQTSLLRGLLLSALGTSGDEATVAEAKRRFEAHRTGGAALHNDLRGAVYGIVTATGGMAEWEHLTALYEATDDATEKTRLLRSLAGRSKDIAVLKKTLEFSLGDKVRFQDMVYVVGPVAANPEGTQIAWEFVKENWDMLVKRFEGGFLLSHISGLPGNFTTEEKAKEVEEWWAKVKMDACERSVQQAIESIRNTAQWKARDMMPLVEWLKTQ